MKFRTIFILFNVVIAVSFLFIFLLPLSLLGPAYTLDFWKGNWYLALFFLALLAVLDIFFALHWKTFSLIERKDWSGLSTLLVKRIFVTKRFSGRDVSLLVDAYLLQGEVAGIEKLEEELAARNPALLRKKAVLFGLTRLLRSRSEEAERFLAPYLSAKDVENREWLRFDYAFSLVLQRKIPEAIPYLREGAAARDAVLALISAYLLKNLGAFQTIPAAEQSALMGLAESVRTGISKRFPGNRWEREVERAKGDFQVVVLSKLVDEASRWLAEAAEVPGKPAAAAANPSQG